MGSGQNLSQKEKGQIYLLYKYGYSIMDVATLVGRSKSTVKRVLKAEREKSNE